MPAVALACAIALAGASLIPVEAQPPPPQQQPEQLRGQRGRGGLQQPQRDRARPMPAGTASIAGRVFAADTGRPVRRARVIVTAGGRPLSTTTDEQGRYHVAGLPAATYNITATKGGFVEAAYGQRRALRAGMPVRLEDGQHAVNVDIKLPRGGVITGRVGDEDGEPLARAVVSAMRYQYVRGERQLMAAGVDQTDDRGQYRIFGLAPGEYCVSAAAGGAMEQIMRNLLETAAAPAGDAAGNVGYAPTYYPGVINPADATRLKVAPGEEVASIDFQVQLVPLATVRGIVNGGSATVTLVPEGGTLGGGRSGGRGGLAELATGLLRGSQPLRTATQPDSTFAIRNVPPGTYTIVARTANGRLTGAGAPRTAVQPILVMGSDVQVALTPEPGVSLHGTVTLEATAGTMPQGFGGFRVNPSPIGGAAALLRGGRGGVPDERGEFTIAGVTAGRYLVRATGPRGWTMKSVYVDGRDVTDEAMEVKGEGISGVNVIFTDRVSAVAGTVRDARGAAAAHLTVVIFTDDDRRWYPQSRHIGAARTDASGAYRIAGLPPGRYLAIAVEDVEQGEWFDPSFLDQVKAGAVRLSLGEGEQKAQDLKATS